MKEPNNSVQEQSKLSEPLVDNNSGIKESNFTLFRKENLLFKILRFY
jgi:hypothetical protein